MIINYILSILLIILLVYIFYIKRKNKKNEREREEVLRRVLEGNLNSRLLCKDKSNYSNINFLINELIEKYQCHIIKMNNNEKKRKELLSNISHDIRTPLTSIIGYLDAINTVVKTKEEKEKYLHIAKNRARHLKVLLDDIFELAKADSNELVLNKKTININSILTDTLIEYIPIIEQDNIELINNIHEEKTYIYADEYSIRRILENLINNALSHGKSGGILGISTSTSGKVVTIEVWDKGEGINEDVDKIFLRLYKKSPSNNTSNNGLGLAIAKTLVEKHDGEIEVVSIPNEKTSFIVHFPLSKQ